MRRINREGKGGKYLRTKHPLFEKKNREGKGGKYVEKENIWSTEKDPEPDPIACG